MAKHAAPRTRRSPFWTLLGAGTLACGLTVASLVPLPTVTATAMPSGEVCYDLHGGELCRADQVRTLPQGGVEVGDGSYDLTHEDTSDVTCWVEKWQDVATAEALCGPRGLRPAGSVELGTEVAVGHQLWVATMAGLEPVPTN